MNYKVRKDCRVCHSKKLRKFLSLGNMPLPNAFLSGRQLDIPEKKYPLDVCFCTECGMVQLEQIVDAPNMFENYAYFTGASDPIRKHFNAMADEIIREYTPGNGSLVVDIGSNDGTLLQAFKNKGMRVLGIDPAKNIAEYANKQGIETLCGYFNEDIIRRILAVKEHPAIITATNVFAHVDDLDSFIINIKLLMKTDGVFIFEVPYWLETMDKVEFDTIYHEHLSYFAVKPLQVLFSRFGMYIAKVELIDVHGGSLRVHVKNGTVISKVTVPFIDEEFDVGLYKVKTYEEFTRKVKRIKKDLREVLVNIKKDGEKVVGYGASAKGNILLNYCKIDDELVEYIADTTVYKQGLYTPGTHILVRAFDKFYADPPEYSLLLAWNYTDTILKKEEKYRLNGGQFIIPIPSPRIV